MADPVSLGLTIALTGLQMGLNALRKIEGPRLTDLKFSGGDPGAPLNYFYGTRRFAGIPIFFAEDIKEKKKKRKTKGGKYNDYTYYGTFAAVIADHEIDAVTRIWLDKHLVYDATSTGPMFAATSDGADSEPLLSLSAYMRIYLGTATQEPDPRMLATIEDRHGVGSCPAYRRIAYLMFEELPLEKVGNRIPQISVEATDSATATFPGEIKDSAISFQAFAYAPSFSYFILAIGFDVHVWNVPTRELISTATLPAEISAESIGLTGEGTFFATAGAFFAAELWLMNIDGGGQLVANISQFAEGCTYVGGTCCIYPYGYIIPEIMALNGATVTTVSEAFVPTHYFPDEDGNAWAVGRQDGESRVCFYKMEGGEYHEVASSSGGDICAFDNGQGQFVIWQDDVLKLVDKDTWTITTTVSAVASFSEQRRRFEATPSGSSRFWGRRFTEYFSADLTAIRTITPTDWGLGDTVSATVYDPINNALICSDGTNATLAWRFLDRIGGNGVTLATITADICNKCGIDASDIDVTALTDTIAGYSYTQGQGSQILEPLHDLYQAFPRPHDFDLQFIKRGASSAGTIDVSEFADNKPRYKVDPKLDNDIPAVVSLTFADPDADQQPNQVDSPRRRGTTEGQGQASYDMGTLVLNVDDAYNLVTRYHRGLWNRNESIENGVTSDYTKLEPGDVWNLALDDETRTTCLTKLTFSSSGELKCEWEKDFAQLATLPDLTGAPADGHEPSVIFMPVQSRALILDIPLLNDSDNQDNPLLYIGAAPFGAGMWPGAVIYQDDGTGDYPLELGTIDSAHAATWGTTTNALADADYTVWDRGNSFNVQLRNGDVPASATEAACNANPRLNRFALGNDGRWEVGQFTTATLEIDGSVTFSGLKRGRRGSEWANDNHAVGDIFVLTETLVPVEMGAGDIGDTISFKAGTSGLDPDEAIPVSVGYDGQSNMPWAPAQFRAVKNYSTGDWVFTWRRRSRVAGDWAPGSPPLGESTENYKLKIYDSLGAVVRTLTPTSETATWTAAQQTTDFGGERWSSVPAGVLQVGDLADGFETQQTFSTPAPDSDLVFVGGASGNGASGSAITVSLTSLTGGVASAPAAGDIVIIGWAPCPNLTPDLDVSVTGYTEAADVYAPGSGVDTNLGAFYKVMGGVPDTTAELSATGGALFEGSYVIHVWRGQHATPIGVVETATGTDQNPNPPEIEPAAERSVIICIGANSCSSSSEDVPAPTQVTAELSNFIGQESIGGGDQTAAGIGSIFWDGIGPFNPAAWDGKGNGFTWAAISLELRSA